MASPKSMIRSAFVGTLKRLPPAAVLRLLLRADQWLYYLQGQIAVTYGQGEHVKHRLMNYHQFFIDRIQPEQRVLDIGCGIGAVARDLAEKSGARVTGIDIKASNIAIANDRYTHPNVTYIEGDVLKTEFVEKFDVVVMSNVLEHLPERPAFLRRVYASAQPTRFLIRVPLFEREWRVPLKKELGVEWRLDPTHEIEFTQETFAAEMAAANLKPIHQEIRWGEIWAELVPIEA